MEESKKVRDAGRNKALLSKVVFPMLGYLSVAALIYRSKCQLERQSEPSTWRDLGAYLLWYMCVILAQKHMKLDKTIETVSDEYIKLMEEGE